MRAFQFPRNLIQSLGIDHIIAILDRNIHRAILKINTDTDEDKDKDLVKDTDKDTDRQGHEQGLRVTHHSANSNGAINC